jgi:hypothetical protein
MNLNWNTINKVADALLVISLILLLSIPSHTTIVRAGQDDSNDKEVGVEWVEIYYDPNLGNLTWTQEEAEGFYNALGDKGWTKSFNWGNDLAWESDFEDPSVGGSDYIWIDSVDFAWFSGHGAPRGFYFSRDHDGDHFLIKLVHYTEVKWGDKDLEWIVISGCEVLQWKPEGLPDAIDRWGPAFKGLHVMMGFDTVRYDQLVCLTPWGPCVSPGERMVTYMTRSWPGPVPIGYAWRLTTGDWQPDNVYAALLAVVDYHNGYFYDNDYLPGYGYVGPDIDDPMQPGYGFVYRRWQC